MKSMFDVIDEALAESEPTARRERPRRTRRSIGLGPRAVTVSLKHGKVDARASAATHADEYRVLEAARPRTREDCRDAARPCPFVACRHHLYLDVTPAGSIKFNYPTREPWELEHSCALDVTDSGPQTLEEVGALMNITRERTRQVEVAALLKLKRASNHADATLNPIPTEEA